MEINQFTQQLMEITAQTQLWHWQTDSYAEHVALGSFYDSWIDKADSFVETYSGRYTRPKAIQPIQLVDYKSGASLPFMQELASLLAAEDVRSMVPDTDLNNILDELQSLASQTAYMLTLKK